MTRSLNRTGRRTLVAVGLVTVFATQARSGEGGERVAAKAPRYTMGTQVLAIPAMPRPERGKTVLDPVFGTRITRITDGSDGWGTKMRRHSYATFSPLNRDGSRATFQEARWHLYDMRTFRHLGELKGPFGDSGAPRWDGKDRKVFYFARDTAFYQYEITTGRTTLLREFKKDFPAMRWLFHPAYVEPSADTRYWGFLIMAQGEERGEQIAKITYDLKRNRIVGTLPGRSNRQYGRYVSVSPSGKRVVVGEYVDGKRRNTSCAIDFSDPVPLRANVGHLDLGIDVDGREVAIYGNDDTDFIAMQDLETGRETPLLSYIHGTTWAERRNLSGQGFHLSGNAYATPGWVVVSTYGYRKKKTHWNSHTIYLLKLDPKADPTRPTIWRVAHNRSVWDAANPKHYWAEPHASIDRYGKSIVFASNWGDPQAPIEAYRLDLPAGWYEKLTGSKRAGKARAKTARLLGISVRELTGK